MIIETFRQAIQNVWSNKLRTFLTMLGIIIGVMAVIVIVGLGNGMTKSMRDSFSALGTNTLSIQVWGYGSRTVPVEDMYDICQRHSDLIKAVSPQIEFSGKASGTLKIGTTSYRWSNISGVDESYTEMKNYQIAQGRGLQYMDMQDNKQVCIIGDYLNRVAFGGNGVGQTLKIGANKFRIVGVLAAKVSNPTMQQGSDDDCVYLPYTTVMRLSSQSAVNNYTAVMTDENFANEAKTTMEEELQKILKTENGYYVYSASEWLEEMNKMINMVIVVLTGIASISLLVGGIGIMNIMLVSVTERTREIGIRKAMGAKEKTILPSSSPRRPLPRLLAARWASSSATSCRPSPIRCCPCSPMAWTSRSARPSTPSRQLSASRYSSECCSAICPQNAPRGSIPSTR